MTVGARRVGAWLRLRRRQAPRAIGYAAAARGEQATEGAKIGLPAQRALIADKCRRRGWELVAIVDDELDGATARPGLDRALRAVSSGDADVLVSVTGDILAPSMESLAELVRLSRRQGWNLYTRDSGLDTTTPAGREIAAFLERAVAVEIRPLELELPPAELMFRVAGTDNEEWFRRSGQLHLNAFDRALRLDGAALNTAHRILDFGCGCGRLLPQLRRASPDAHIFASDVDTEAINWIRAQLPGVDAVVQDSLPPLPFSSEFFDLVISFSVFSHLDEDYQDAWLDELARVLRPGGRAVVTVNGAFSWSWHRENALSGHPELDEMETELRRRGFLHWRGDGWEQFFPDYFHTSWHLPDYIRSRWSSRFEVVSVVEVAAGPTQDVVVLRRPR